MVSGIALSLHGAVLLASAALQAWISVRPEQERSATSAPTSLECRCECAAVRSELSGFWIALLVTLPLASFLLGLLIGAACCREVKGGRVPPSAGRGQWAAIRN